MKLGPVLVQLPPRLSYDTKIAPAFFKDLRARFKGDVVCEPRHVTWFTPAVDKILKRFILLAWPPIPFSRQALINRQAGKKLYTGGCMGPRRSITQTIQLNI